MKLFWPLSFFLFPLLLSTQEQFGHFQILGTFEEATLSIPADMDGDGDIDILAFSNFGNTLYYAVNAGNQSFYNTILIGNNLAEPSHLSLVDFNKDGLQDIVVASEQRLSIYFSSISGTFTQQVIDASYNPIKVYSEDFNGDLLTDLLVIAPFGRLYFYPNNGLGFFTQRILLSEISTFINDVSKGDIDKDGKLDVVFASEEDLYVVKQITKDTYQDPEIFLSTNDRVFAVEMVDINNDTFLDVMVIESGASSPNFSPNSLFYYRNSGNSFSDGLLVESLTFAVSQFDITTLDYNGDGFIDVLLSSISTTFSYYYYDSFLKLSYLPNLGNGSFGQSQSLTDSFGQLNGLVGFSGQPFDIDGDGDTDIVTTSVSNDQLIWFENIPDLAFPSFEASDCLDAPINTSFASYANSSITWDFGNGAVSSEIHPVFPYEEVGDYLITLTICNATDCQITSQEHTVSHLLRPSIPSVALPGEEVTFIDESIGYTNWTWVFGDGEVSIEQVASHVYEEPGIYTVELFVTDSEEFGCTEHFVQEIKVGIDDSPSIPDDPQEIGRRDVFIYPNPSATFVRLLPSHLEAWTFALFNSQGALVGQGNFDNQYELQIANLLPGMYIFRFVNSENRIRYKKLIVIEE